MCYKIQKKYILGSHTRPLKFISAPLKAKHFIGQLWQLMTASNVSARTQTWQKKWAVSKIPGFVFPTPSPLFYVRHFRAVFDYGSSFFAPKRHGNACYAGYGNRDLGGFVFIWRKLDGIESKNGAWLFIYTGSCPGTKNCISNWGETTKTTTIKCTITSSTIQVIYAFSMYRLILI